MTRETKVGLVVGGSFLCLVGVVVAARMYRGGEDPAADQTAQASVTTTEKPPPSGENKKDTTNKKEESAKSGSGQAGPATVVPANHVHVAPLDQPRPPNELPKNLPGDSKPDLVAAAPSLPPAVADPLPAIRPPATTQMPTPAGLPDLPPTPGPAMVAAMPPPPPAGSQAKPPEEGGRNPLTEAVINPPPMVPGSAPPAVRGERLASTPPSVPAAVPPPLSAGNDPPPLARPDTVAAPWPPPPARLDTVAAPLPTPSSGMTSPLPVRPDTAATAQPPSPATEKPPVKPPPLAPVVPASDKPPTAMAMVNPPAKPAATIRLPVPAPEPAANPASEPRPNPANPGAGSPQVRNYDMKTHHVQPGETSLADISKRYYQTDKYGRALLMFNRGFPLTGDNLQQESPRLQPGQAVFIPPREVLESSFPNALGEGRPTTTAPTTAPVTVRPPTPPNAAATPPAAQAAPPGSGTSTQSWAAPDKSRRYRVRDSGEYLLEIAHQALGDSRRWTEIYRLNPNIRPEYPIPGGTELRIPLAN